MRKQWRSWRPQQAPSPSWPNPCRSWSRWSSMWRAWRRPWWSLRWGPWLRTRERENSSSAANVCCRCVKSSVIAVLLFRLTSRRCRWGSWVRGRSRARTLSLLKSTRWVTSDQAHVRVPSSVLLTPSSCDLVLIDNRQCQTLCLRPRYWISPIVSTLSSLTTLVWRNHRCSATWTTFRYEEPSFLSS